MNYTLETEKDIRQLSKFGVDLKIYSAIDETCGVVLVHVEDGHNEEFRHLESTFTYIVLEGRGTFYLNDESVDVSKGDRISIKPNTNIYYKGKMQMVLITTPAWSAEQEVEVRQRVW